MKKLVKVLTLVLALTLAMAPAIEAQAKTKTLNITTVTHQPRYDYGKEVKTTGNYKVNITKKTKTAGSAFIIFTAPKDGVYQIKMSGLNCKKNTQGINTSIRVGMDLADKNWDGAKGRTYYFAGKKDYNYIQFCGNTYYKFCQSIDKKEYEEFVKSTTINCKLKKGDHLTISFHDFDGLDGLYTKDTYMFNMSIKKK